MARTQRAASEIQMEKHKFAPEDWALIKYGSHKGDYCRISMADKFGRYVVIPYDAHNEPGKLQTLGEDSLELLPPLLFSEGDMKGLVTCESMYRDYKDRIFPPFNVKASGLYAITAYDIRDALLKICSTEDPLNEFREWFWTIENILYDHLFIEPRYRENLICDGPESDDDIFSVVFGMAERLYWRLEERYNQRETIERFVIRFDEKNDWDINNGEHRERITKFEENALRTVADDIISRVNVYEYNKTLPCEEWVYSESEKRHFISGYDSNEKLEAASDDEIETYKTFLEDLYNEGDVKAMNALARGYFGGNRAFDRDMVLAKKYYEEYFAKTGDPYAANALGVICYYDLSGADAPEYEKAFGYFLYASAAEVDAASCRAADMLIEGKGTAQNIDMGMSLIINGYRRCMHDFCGGDHTNALAEYAFRMGNICRDSLVLSMGKRDAYKFYLEARLAADMRGSEDSDHNSEGLNEKIDYEIEKIREEYHLDTERNEIKTDFPLFLNQLFDDGNILKITIDVKKDAKDGFLVARRYLADEDEMHEQLHKTLGIKAPQIMAAYPELSYAEMTSFMIYGLENVTVAQKQAEGNTFFADRVRKNEATNALEFFSGPEIVAALEAQWYVIRVDKSK